MTRSKIDYPQDSYELYDTLRIGPQEEVVAKCIHCNKKYPNLCSRELMHGAPWTIGSGYRCKMRPEGCELRNYKIL